MRAWWHGFWSGSDKLALGVGRVILVVLLALAAYRLASMAVHRIFIRGQKYGRYLDRRRADTLASTLTSLLRYGIVFLAAGMILPIFGVNISAFIAAAGIGGVALAFGAQSLVRDVVTGFFLLLEGQLAVGDTVTAAGVTGVVEEAGLRVTKIRDGEGCLHTIPNGQITQVANLSGPFLAGRVDVPVAAGAELSALEETIASVCRTFAASHGERLLEGPAVTGLMQGEAGLVLRVGFKAPPIWKDRVETELRRALYLAVTRAGFRWAEG